MSFFDDDRQHPATPAKLKRAREEGDAAHSHELAFAIQMVDDAIIGSSQSFLWFTLRLVVPVMAAIFVVGAVSHLLQTRFLVNRPKLSVSRLSPLNWFGNVFSLRGMPTDVFAASLLNITGTAAISVAGSLLACSVVDYAVQWFSFQQRNRLTDQELREEIRGQTGDPQVAKVRHQRMREITGR